MARDEDKGKSGAAGAGASFYWSYAPLTPEREGCKLESPLLCLSNGNSMDEQLISREEYARERIKESPLQRFTDGNNDVKVDNRTNESTVPVLCIQETLRRANNLSS